MMHVLKGADSHCLILRFLLVLPRDITVFFLMSFFTFFHLIYFNSFILEIIILYILFNHILFLLPLLTMYFYMIYFDHFYSLLQFLRDSPQLPTHPISPPSSHKPKQGKNERKNDGNYKKSVIHKEQQINKTQHMQIY